jgi:hypothetical protein
VIRLAREAMDMTAQDAAEASRARDGKGVSAAYWRDVERGHGGRRGQRVPTRASARALAAMARVVGVRPAQLAGAGREDAARVLEEILRREGPPRALAAVPSPPASLEPGPGDIFPDVEPEMRPMIDAKLPALRHLYRLAAIKSPDMSGTAIFTDSPHEAERWDRLVEAGYAEKPGEGYTPAELLFLMATGRVFDDQYRAASGDPARRRKALISIT